MQKLIALLSATLATYVFINEHYFFSLFLTLFTIGLLQTTKKNLVLDFENAYSDGYGQSQSERRR